MSPELISYYIGITIVFLTHFFMLVMRKGYMSHSLINLLAVALIAFYFVSTAKSFI